MIYKIISSYKTMVVLLLILAVGAAVGTFIENDFGSSRAKELVYNSWWYELVLLLSTINLIVVMYKTKMYKIKTRMIFHISFVVILIGASITHFFGIDGVMHIREGEKSNIIVVQDKNLEVPFYLHLNNFNITRYPGSRSPSEFSSEVTVMDKNGNKESDTKIYMNHTLTHMGYKFFQTSFDPDEKGTKLSVNKDPGVEITYIGYTLLFLGLVLNFFDKKSRFQFLIGKIKKMPIASLILPLILLIQTHSYAQQSSHLKEYLKNHKENSVELANAFGSLVVQGPVGRMKPLDT